MEVLLTAGIERLVHEYLNKLYQGTVGIETAFLAEKDGWWLFSVSIQVEKGVDFIKLQTTFNEKENDMAIAPDLRCYGQDAAIRLFLSIRKGQEEDDEQKQDQKNNVE